MERGDALRLTRQEAEAIAAPLGLEILRVEFVREGSRRILRVVIQKEGGVSVRDCEILSRSLSRRLDAMDFIHNRYYLEVSSPGI